MKVIFGFFVLFCNANWHLILSQQAYNTQCDQFGQTKLSRFNQNKYMSFWFIHATYDYSDVEGRDCLTSNYTTTTKGRAKILERSRDLKRKEWDVINSLMLLDNNGKGHYEYQIPDENIEDWPIDIIATDYKSYSIEWSCLPNESGSLGYIWIMSPDRYIDNRFWTKVDPILRRHNISKTNLRIVKQDQKFCSD